LAQIEDIVSEKAVEHRPAVQWRDFQIVLAAAVALLALILLGERIPLLQPIRLVLGLAFVLYVPGYCLIAAAFPRAGDIDGIERAGLSIGLSVALMPVLALLLDELPGRLGLWPIVVAVYGVTALGMAAALLQRSRLAPGTAYAPPLRWQPRAWWRGLPLAERRIYAGMAGVLVFAAAAAIWILAVPSPGDFMTEFYMLGKEGLVENYPREAAAGEEIGVTLGVMNRERGAQTYRVEVWAADPWTADKRVQVAAEGPFELARGEAREWPVAWQMPWTGDDQVVELLLYTSDRTEPYRSLRLWLNVEPAGS
jgi:uncharacterized membrane protein